MKLLIAALAAALLAPQAPPTPLVFGPQAATIRPSDIESITRAVTPYGGAPWLLTDFRSTPSVAGRQWRATAYLPPSTATDELRRGSVVYVESERTTQTAPDPTTWKVSTLASAGLGSPGDASAIQSWAQVALPRRPFDDLASELDENLPLIIRGQITDADLVSSVRFLRTRPPLPTPSRGWAAAISDGTSSQSILSGFAGPVRGVLAPAFLNPSLPAVRLSIAAGNGCSWSVLLQRRWSEPLQRRDGEWFIESIERGGVCN